MDAPAFLRIRHLIKTFGSHRAVDDVSIDIAKGEVFALLGSSGCGKTTLLRMLAGFETPTSGTIELDGRDLAGLPPYARPMNMMFQSYALFPHLTVADNVAFGLRREGLGRDEVGSRVEAMLRLVQLQSFAGRKPHQLSGGQQQRVALARSLAKRPQLLLLDEPLGALDKKLREETQIELSRIIHDIGVTCVMVTHDQDEAMTMASRIAVMSEGRFVQVGAPAEIYEAPIDRFVADFIGDVNLLEGRVAAADADALCVEGADFAARVEGRRGLAVGRAVTVAVRPEKIGIAAAPAGPVDGATAEANRLRGIVRDVAYFGSATVYHLQLASGRIVKVRCSNARRDDHALDVGDPVEATWPAAAAIVLER